MKNLQNQRFGRLIALKPTKNRDGNNCVIWECLCDCGNITYIPSRNLRNGKTKSCGCIQKEIISKINADAALDLIGYRFGKLVVTEKTPLRNHEHIIWKCKCDCGKDCYVASHYLRNGDTSSCGCIASKGEIKIENILQQNKIHYVKQKTFESCRFPETNALAKFDFYLPDFHMLIEYDGRQHFYYQENTSGWNNKEHYERTKERDAFKNKWCEENNIKLVRVPYTKYESMTIEDLLS